MRPHMPQAIRHVEIESFLSSIGHGKIDFEQSIRRLHAVCEVWNQDVSQNVLLDVRGRQFDLTPSEIKRFVEIVAKTGLGHSNKVAFVYRHRGNFDPPVFVEALAQDIGLSIRAFDDYEFAIEWLANEVTPLAVSDHD